MKCVISSNIEILKDNQIRELFFNLTERDQHSRITINFEDISLIDKSKNIHFVFEGILYSQQDAPITLLIKWKEDGIEKTDTKKLFVGTEKRRITTQIKVPVNANSFSLCFVFSKNIAGECSLFNMHIINGDKTFSINEDKIFASKIDTKKIWFQRGSDLVCKSYLGEFFFNIPFAWNIRDIPNENFLVANYLLFSKAERHLLSTKENIKELISSLPTIESNNADEKSTALLSYSFGEDSTAAASLLPSSTVKYYAKRDHTSYTMPNGSKINVNPYEIYEKSYGKVSELIVIRNNLEKIGPAAGLRHGFTHNFGYGAIGILIAPLFNAKAICFGSVMEQVFLKNGTNYTDILKLKSSAFNLLNDLFKKTGVSFCLPTGGCSEVITSKICEIGPLARVAHSCPNVDEYGNACLTCFKCFRKYRMQNTRHLPEPNTSVLELLQKRPLKSATSLLYALNKSNETSKYVSDYEGIDFSFLERYHGTGAKGVIPEWLQPSVFINLKKLGFEQMSEKDEETLRTIGKVLDPSSYDVTRSGL
jgi:hypothetical protein